MSPITSYSALSPSTTCFIEQMLLHVPFRIEKGKWRKIKENEKQEGKLFMNTTEEISQLSSFLFLLWNLRDLLKPTNLLQMPGASHALDEIDSHSECRDGRQWGWSINRLWLER